MISRGCAPINSATCGDKFNNAFSYATNFAAADIVPTGSYDAAYKAALLHMMPAKSGNLYNGLSHVKSKR